MSKPRKHHYLPQFYLRQFSKNGRFIFQIEKKEARGYLCAIKDAAAIRDFHELDYEDAEDPQVVEKRLAAIEGQLASAIAHVIDVGIDSDVSHLRLVEFVSLMRVRVPAFKQSIENALRQIVRTQGKILERKGKLPHPPKGLEGIFERDGVSISISNWKCMELMFGLGADPEILGLLASMTPSVLRAPADRSLLTCDQPVAIFHPDANPGDTNGIGLAHPGTQVSLPLSSTTLLLLTWDKKTRDNPLMSHAEIDEFNRRTVVMAEAWVFAPEESELSIATVGQYKNCWAGIELQVLDMVDSALHLSTFRPVMLPEKYIATT